MGTANNLKGSKYGRLTVLRIHTERSKNRKIQWVCQCDCGNEATVRSDHLRGGFTQSCGCLRNRMPRGSSLSRALWERVDKSPGHGPDGDCWEWTGFKQKGYGRFMFQGRKLFAHRVAWELTKGQIPSDLHVLHTCDNPPCCNPEHLWLGTQADNNRDRDEKGRARYLTGDEHWTQRKPERIPRGSTHYTKKRPHFIKRGEQNAQSKLTEKEVLEIRLARSNGETLESIAKRYGVTLSCIWNIAKRKTWRHVR